VDITFGAHAAIGWMEHFGSSKDVPFFERFYVGSGSTVRGFEWGKAGPSSAQGTPLGGDCVTAGNLEVRFPIYQKLKGVLFYDTGRAFNGLDELGHIDLRDSAGLGLRYLTPWLVVRADYG
jgi:outer membrane protein insertion porin family